MSLWSSYYPDCSPPYLQLDWRAGSSDFSRDLLILLVLFRSPELLGKRFWLAIISSFKPFVDYRDMEIRYLISKTTTTIAIIANTYLMLAMCQVLF